MKRLLLPALALGLTMAVGSATAQDSSSVTVNQLTEHIYQLTTDQGAYTTTTLVSVGDDGLLIVDTQAEENAADLKAAVEGFGKGAPKIIINTHRHVEHVCGNDLWGEDPIVIAHYKVAEKLRSKSYIWEEFPASTFADIVVVDSLTLDFNGEKIRLIEMAGSHDDNEIIVHFTKSKVVHVSSLTNGFNFPSVDADGSALEFAPVVKRAIAALPEDVVVVSGHNGNGTIQDMKDYVKMLEATESIVRAGLDAGKTVEEMQADSVLKDWTGYAGSYVGVNGWISTMADAIEPEEPKKSLYEPLYYAWKDGGAEAAIAKYQTLRDNHADEYDLSDIPLLVIGDKLVLKKETGAAIKFLELNLAEFPDGNYAYYTNFVLAGAYKELGDKDNALKFCKKSLELNPDFQAAAGLQDEIDAM